MITSDWELAVYIVGDRRTQFPALTAFKSFQAHNPGRLRFYYFVNADELDDRIVAQMTELGVEVVNARELGGFDSLMSLDLMGDGEWPAEVYLNWAVPEFLADQGHRFSLKLDFDVLCTGPVDELMDLVSGDFFCSALVTAANPSLPESALEKVKSTLGYDKPRKFAINSGVMLLNNDVCREIGLLNVFLEIMHILRAECPEIPTAEQAAIAIIISNHEDRFRKLPTAFNQRALARAFPLGYHNDARIIHFLRDKPWHSFGLDQHRALASSGWAVLPAYRNLWLEYASAVDGFDDFTSERPYSAQDLISLVSTTLTLDRKHWEKVHKRTEQRNVEKAERLALNKRRRELSELVGERLDWTVGYGPFAGLKMSRETWWSRPSRGSMFLGLYEQEVLNSLFDVDQKYRVFVDVGAADGYYAVGAVASGRFDRCYCFEIDERGQELIKANAEANGVTDRVTVFGEAHGSSWDLVPADELAAAVVMVDIEGAEFDLLTSSAFARLTKNVVIVEVHPFLVEDGDAKLVSLRERAEPTHTVSAMTTTARDLSGFPEVADLGDTDRWLICSEGRKELMTWLRFDPRGAPPKPSVVRVARRLWRGEVSVQDVASAALRRARTLRVWSGGPRSLGR